MARSRCLWLVTIKDRSWDAIGDEVDPELLDRADKICYNEDKDKKNRAFGIRNKTKGTKISSR